MVLAVVVFAVMVVRTWEGTTEGDFYVHAAVVRELAARPLQPRHAQLSADAAHEYYSPYALAAGLVSRFTGVSAVDTLRAFGIVNLILLLIAMRRLAGALEPGRADAVAFYALLFTLLLWGAEPWYYSGFLHLPVLAAVLPYPSTFALALGLLVAATTRRSKHATAATAIALAVVLVTHPIAFIIVAALMIARLWRDSADARRKTVIALTAAVMLAIVWPYYSLLHLSSTDVSSFYDYNVAMYERVVGQTWPALAGVVAIALLWRADRRHPLPIGALLLAAVYAAGAISGAYFFGRVISGLVMMLHFAIAMVVSRIEVKTARLHLVTAMVFAICVAISYTNAIRPQISELAAGRRPPDPLAFVARFVGHDDVVMAGEEDSLRVTAFAGKVVAASNPMTFVPDLIERKAAAGRFFDASTAATDRDAIIRRYAVQWILIDKAAWPDWWSLTNGRPAYEDARYALVAVEPASGSR